MNRQELFELIDKWTRGEASEQEIKSLMNYYYSFRDTPEWDEMQLGDRQQLASEMEERILENIRRAPRETAPIRRIWWPRVAVAAVLLLLGGALWMYVADWRKLSGPVKEEIVAALPGQHRQVGLPDGTQVWLSPSSTLQYSEKFNREGRTVWLSGEAFFDVAQNAVHPFIVVTGGLRTKVLGTSFNIQAYPSQRDFGVTVVSGKVAVSEIHTPATLSKEKPVTLSPRQQAVFNNTTRAINVNDHVDAEQFLLRRTGILKYKGAPVQEVVNTLGNYYNVTINIEGPTEDCFYFGEFNINKGLDKALEQLCLTLNATLVKKGSAYVIRKGRC